MADFKIEHNIPIQNAPRNHYPFPEMKVGDSFQVPKDNFPRLASSASYFGKRNGMKFSIRKNADGYRCWRIK